MVNSAQRPEATLPELLSAHALEVSARRLALDLVGGALLAAAAGLWRPPGWPAVVGAALCFTAFGAWGFAERRLAGDPPVPGAPLGHGRATGWRAVHALAGAVGALAAALLVFGVLFGVLGTWIS